MQCPFSKQICLLPKEISVTELQSSGCRNLFLCQLCGSKYLEQLNSQDSVSKSVDTISSKDGIKSEQVEVRNDVAVDDFEENMRTTTFDIEKKLNKAVAEENYEAAAHLRDILKAMAEAEMDLVEPPPPDEAAE